MMNRSSHDMIGLVWNVGKKLETVVPRYQRIVSHELPQAKFFRAWLKTFVEVHERFFQKKDHRHTSQEFGDVAELAQYLINLHSATEGTTPKQLTIHEEDMIVREKIYG